MPKRSSKFAFLSYRIVAGRRRGSIDVGKIIMQTCLDCDVNICQMLEPGRATPAQRAQIANEYAGMIIAGGFRVCCALTWWERSSFSDDLRLRFEARGIPFLRVTEVKLLAIEPTIRELFA